MINITKKTISKSKEKEYPYLGEYLNGSRSKIVLFISINRGICLSSTTKNEVGILSSSLAEHVFKPYKGELIISNK